MLRLAKDGRLMVISTISIAISPPRFIDAQRAFKMGSRTESCPVVHGGPGDAFRRPRACRCRLGAGDEAVSVRGVHVLQRAQL
jgi:hypothetical protein